MPFTLHFLMHVLLQAVSLAFDAARNKAQMEGLLSVFPVAQTEDRMAGQLPIFSDSDQAALTYLSKEFEIDFLCLSFTEHATDIHAARKFLNSLGLNDTKVHTLHETISMQKTQHIYTALSK